MCIMAEYFVSFTNTTNNVTKIDIYSVGLTGWIGLGFSKTRDLTSESSFQIVGFLPGSIHFIANHSGNFTPAFEYEAIFDG